MKLTSYLFTFSHSKINDMRFIQYMMVMLGDGFCIFLFISHDQMSMYHGEIQT